MTMEDAAELAWHVQQYGLTADALERFEAKRIPRVTKILDHAKVRTPATVHAMQGQMWGMLQRPILRLFRLKCCCSYRCLQC